MFATHTGITSLSVFNLVTTITLVWTYVKLPHYKANTNQFASLFAKLMSYGRVISMIKQSWMDSAKVFQPTDSPIQIRDFPLRLTHCNNVRLSIHRSFLYASLII